MISVTDIGTNSNLGAATVTLTGVTVPANSLIVVCVTEYAAAPAAAGSVADGGTNSYVLTASQSPGNIRGLTQLFRVESAAALSGATITYTKNASGNRAVISAFYATGILSVGAFDAAVTQTAFANSTTPSVTSGTPAVAGELFVAVCGQAATTGSPGTYTQDTGNGWAVPPAAISIGSASPFAAVAGGNQINSGTGTIAFTPTLSVAAPWAALVVGFKPELNSKPLRRIVYQRRRH